MNGLGNVHFVVVDKGTVPSSRLRSGPSHLNLRPFPRSYQYISVSSANTHLIGIRCYITCIQTEQVTPVVTSAVGISLPTGKDQQEAVLVENSRVSRRRNPSVNLNTLSHSRKRMFYFFSLPLTRRRGFSFRVDTRPHIGIQSQVE